MYKISFVSLRIEIFEFFNVDIIIGRQLCKEAMRFTPEIDFIISSIIVRHKEEIEIDECVM